MALSASLRRGRRSRRALLAASALAGIGGAARARDASPAATAPPTVAEVVVTARRLAAARATIQPQIGASVYTIDRRAIEALPGGANTGLNQVVLQAPGVAQDSFGQLHVRGEHNGLQYRLDGVILPEGLSVFGQALSPRLADKVQLITGALPAQYGLRTGGIVDIATRSGEFANGGAVSLYGGSHDEIEPSLEYGGGDGRFNAFVSLSYLHSALGIELPDASPTPLHDVTDQLNAFAYLSEIVDPSDRVALILGASNQRFQIPNRPGLTPSLMFGPNGDQPLIVEGRTTFDSAVLNESQKEATDYAVATWLRDAGALTSQISLFGRYSSLTFVPDALGDLLFDGIAQSAFKRDLAGGLQAEAVWRIGGGHTLRGGVIGELDRSISDTTSQVIALDPASGSQLSDQPISIVDDGGRTAKSLSLYLQDEWQLLANLTVNYGLRFDQVDGLRDENQLSPRLNAVWKPTATTTIHAGYSRYFSPPPFELVAAPTIAKFVNTTAAPAVLLDTTPYAERANYFDVGIAQKLWRGLTASIDAYDKISKNLVDEGQFGAPIILTPFNYAHGRQEGVEFNLDYAHGPLTAYANLALAKATGEDIVSSQFNFSPDVLAYIADHSIYLDHDQAVTGSAGLSYFWKGTRLGGDLIYGSGLRATAPGGVPNGDHLPAYVQVNLALSHRFDGGALDGVTLRFDVVNLFDEVYEIRDGTGVGVGAPQFGPRRGFFGGVTKTF